MTDNSPRNFTVDITFLGPFRVASGQVEDGLDATVRLDNPLPASTLKGLMRAQASMVLGLPVEIVEDVFGSPRSGSAWWWSDAELSWSGSDDLNVRTRSQLRIDPERGTAVKGALRTVGEVWPAGGRFSIRRRDAIPVDRVPIHLAVLNAAARSVTALGSDRRRGLGWVGFVPDLPWDDEQSRLILGGRDG